MQIPQTLDELGEGLLLWEQLNNELPSIEAKISPLFDQFAILDKYEVTVAEKIRTMLTETPAKFRDFEQTLVDADVMLKKNKVHTARYVLSYTDVIPLIFQLTATVTQTSINLTERNKSRF